MRKPLAVANWKMNKNRREAAEFAEELKKNEAIKTAVDIVICPPITCLSKLEEIFQDTSVQLGAQNCFWEQQGAYTGEIAPQMLRDVGCNYVIIGHSERRQLMGETDFHINRKLIAALTGGLAPILCVGETRAQREQNLAAEVITRQLEQGLERILLGSVELVIAYEPVWAIGTGVNATGADAQEMAGFIRASMRKMYSRLLSDNLRILYGGSVNKDNIAEFAVQPDIDGALIGGASLQAESFSSIVRLMTNA